MKIKRIVYDQIVEHAKKELPIEACGYLAGKHGVIEKAYMLTNMDKSPEHFSFDPREQFEVIRDANKYEYDIIGNWHSHPETPARPSEEDIKLAFDPNILYFIVSLKDIDQPDLKGFSIVDKVVEKVDLEVI